MTGNIKCKNKYILGMLLTALISISAHAQIDITHVERRIDKIEQFIERLQESQDASNNELKELQTRKNSLQKSINSLTGSNKVYLMRINELIDLLDESSIELRDLGQQLDRQKMDISSQITETKIASSKSVSELEKALGKNTIYLLVAILSVALLSIVSLVLLKRKVAKNTLGISESLSVARRELEQEGIRLDEKLVALMEAQMRTMKDERNNQPEGSNSDQDHSLALKVADEIVRIEKNICRMDEGTKGLKQLSKAIERIRDNFAANGYEMVDMLNVPYEEGMKASVTFRIDPDLNGPGSVITRIIKPQVNYKGVMIQQAQIEVSQAE